MSNAFTPIPTWPVDLSRKGKWVPTSKEIPLNEASYSAMDFDLWKKIGTEFLVKSNIMHWFSCKPGIGDLVNWQSGNITCKNVKNVGPICTKDIAAAVELDLSSCGPVIKRVGKGKNTFLKFDGKISVCSPAHDPCGTTSFAFMQNPTNGIPPRGALYIR